MKLRTVLFNILLFLLPILTFASSLEDEIYYREKFKTSFLKNGVFKSNDPKFELQNGSWKLSGNTMILSEKSDSVAAMYKYCLTYSSSNKVVLTSKKSRIALHDKESSGHASGLSAINILKGILGMAVLFLIGFLFSKNRKAISWSLVAKGTILQLILAVLILKVPFISVFFDFLAKSFTKVIDFSHEGAVFLFGSAGQMPPLLQNFAFWILPTVVFVSALSSVLYYFGILQFVVKGMAWVMNRFLGISGAESVAAAANVFVGQTEAPLLVKPYLEKMTRSEILCLMVGGMATIAGGVLAAVVGILSKGDPVMKLFYAKHLLTASLMSAPAAIVFAKMLLPETEEFDKNLDVSKDKIGVNVLEAISNGTTDGLKLAVNVGAMLIVFTSLIALLNYFLMKIGDWTTLNAVISAGGMYATLSFQSLSGYVLAPFSWLLGVEWQDCMYFGQLLGEKTIINEFIAYPHLGEIQDELSQKTVIMSTYVLCGFANIVSIGIQVGGIGILAPSKKSLLAQLGLLALLGGTLACMSTAVLVGMFY